MDNKFIDLRDNTSKDGGVITFEHSKLEPSTTYHAMAFKIPSRYGESHQKRLIEAFYSYESQIIQRTSVNKESYNSKLSTDGINMDFVFMLRELANFTGYFINTTSWKDQQMHEFDRQELKSRLQKVIKLL